MMLPHGLSIIAASSLLTAHCKNQGYMRREGEDPKVLHFQLFEALDPSNELVEQ